MSFAARNTYTKTTTKPCALRSRPTKRQMATSETESPLPDWDVPSPMPRAKRRATAATLMNAESSRSHAVVILYIDRSDHATAKKKGRKFSSKLNLVDLAGSERVVKSGATPGLTQCTHSPLHLCTLLTVA